MNGSWEEAELPEGYRLDFRERTGSTNDDVRVAAKTGVAAGLVVVAGMQEAGRGRRGAGWVCPAGEGLAFSVLLRPEEPKVLWPRLSLAAGLAVAEALDRHGVAAEVKWPNDVWVGGKKIAGILVEAGEDFVVVGIGVNVRITEFPDPLAESATSLLLETGTAPVLPEVLIGVLERLAVWQRCVGAGFGDLLARFRERCALTGNRIRLTAVDGVIEGNAEGIGEGGVLLLRTDQGDLRKIVQAEEVRVV